ncbi:MAG: PIG-L family deacetylase [Synergistaceae bacterium]|nr:PIG-L family deacetylase [Synergistaceae bacterium]
MDDIVIETWKKGSPHKGKVCAAVFPHSDDFSLSAGGLIIKLIGEGYAGYFIRTSNDEMDSYDLTAGETIFRIEQETRAVANFFGIQKVYDLNYKNHYLDHALLTEMRHRLIALFRFLKVDTVISFDPWGHYEENPDHYITAMAVEQACWMSGRQLDLPELKDMGIVPHFVTEKYYCARGPQESNLIVDISDVLEKKIDAIEMHQTPIDNMWKEHLAVNGYPLYKDKRDFIKKALIESKPIREDLRYYEKYRHII